MTGFDQELTARLDRLKGQNLYRELRRVCSPQGPRMIVAGEALLNFASNDYLGLANEPSVKEAAAMAISRYGAGSGGSRLLGGSLAPFHELEEALAHFKGLEAALAFSSGYTAAVGTVCSLLDKDDVVILDKLSHACLVDAARLSGACLRIFRHNDLEDLESILKWAVRRRKPDARTDHKASTLIITESVFSMDGDHAPLQPIVALKQQYGAWLMVDEAHATGLYGRRRRGRAEELDVADQIEVQMGTLGKAFGSSGGYICGSRALIDFLVNRARPFIFSTAPVPAAAAAATAAIGFVGSRSGEVRCKTLWERAAELALALDPTAAPAQSAIRPIIVGDELRALGAAASLRAERIYAPAVRYPTVPRGSARLRLTISAAHKSEDIAHLVSALRNLNLISASAATRSPRAPASQPQAQPTPANSELELRASLPAPPHAPAGET